MKRDKMKMKMKDERSRAKAPTEVTPVTIARGANGFHKIILQVARGSSAEIYLHGAQVTSWKNEHGEELLFVSSKANFSSDMSVRGGIPIFIPQFLDLGFQKSLEFVRNGIWRIGRHSPLIPIVTAKRAYVDLILEPTEEDLRMWPHSFEFRLRVSLSPSGDLMLTSRIINTHTERKTLRFMFAYNTYFTVSDIRKIQVEVETLNCIDNINTKKRVTCHSDELTFEAKVDKTYLSRQSKIAILDYKKKRAIEIHKEGIPDAVWNTWDKKAKAIAVLGRKNYTKMFCLRDEEAQHPVILKSDKDWTGMLKLTSVEKRRKNVEGQKDEQASNRRYYTTWLK